MVNSRKGPRQPAMLGAYHAMGFPCIATSPGKLRAGATRRLFLAEARDFAAQPRGWVEPVKPFMRT